MELRKQLKLGFLTKLILSNRKPLASKSRRVESPSPLLQPMWLSRAASHEAESQHLSLSLKTKMTSSMASFPNPYSPTDEPRHQHRFPLGITTCSCVFGTNPFSDDDYWNSRWISMSFQGFQFEIFHTQHREIKLLRSKQGSRLNSCFPRPKLTQNTVTRSGSAGLNFGDLTQQRYDVLWSFPYPIWAWLTFGPNTSHLGFGVIFNPLKRFINLGLQDYNP